MKPLRIGLLGNTQAQASRLERLLDVPHTLLLVPATGAAGDAPLDLDALLTLRFTAGDASRIHCRLLQCSGVGLDGIAMDAVPAETAICNVKEHGTPIAEYVMLAMLEHQIGAGRMAAAFRNETWGESFRTRVPHGELAGLTLGLVGFGEIGVALAARARAFGMRIMTVTASGTPRPEADWTAAADRLDDMLVEADFIVLACPLTAETRGLIDARRLALLKPSALLINVARGEVVDEAALFAALERSSLAGAVLDAWYDYPTPTEPDPWPSRHRFDQLPNVRCTPHSSGWTRGLIERRYRTMADNLRRLHAGEPLLNCVRPAAVARSGESQ